MTAAEPGRFIPAAAAAPLEPPAPADDLRIGSVLTASFLAIADSPLEEVPAGRPGAGNAGPVPRGTVPKPAGTPPDPAAAPPNPAGVPPGAAGAAGGRRTAVETLPPPGQKPPGQQAMMPPKPSMSPQIPGLALDDRPDALLLAEVLRSVLMSYPLLQAVERERGVAAGRLTTAMGAFDTRVNAAGTSLAPGTYENYRSDFGVAQQFMAGGVSAFGGFRTGFGDFPTYNLAQKTADAGEWRGGLNVPLAKDREIDRFRATRAQAAIDVSLAEPTIERSRLDYMRSAARAYWNWRGSGERYAATEQLLELAVDRDEQLALKVDGGIVANIERVDNQQNIALRNGLVVQADRAMQQASIEMSLYHRDAAGQPLLARRSRMRQLPEPVEPTIEVYERSLARAFGARPEFPRLTLQREKLLVERKLAANQTLPQLDGQFLGNQDAGYGKSPLSGPNGLDRQVLQAALVFQLPVQRRDALGRMQSLEAQITQLSRQLSYAEDQVRAEVQDAFSLLERAYEFHEQSKSRLDLARTVALAERELLRLGRSDVLRVTLREQAKFEAQIAEILARQEFWRAETDLRAADASLGPEWGGLLPADEVNPPQANMPALQMP